MTKENVEFADIELPPHFEQVRSQLRSFRKKLLRDDAFKNPEQLRAFVGQYLFTAMDDLVRVLGAAFLDSYMLAASNANELKRLHYFTVEELNRLGADIDDDEELPGVSAEILDEFNQAFYALGTYCKAKYPSDTALEERYNRCAAIVREMVEELMGLNKEREEREEERKAKAAEDEQDEETPEAVEAEPEVELHE